MDLPDCKQFVPPSISTLVDAAVVGPHADPGTDDNLGGKCGPSGGTEVSGHNGEKALRMWSCQEGEPEGVAPGGRKAIASVSVAYVLGHEGIKRGLHTVAVVVPALY